MLAMLVFKCACVHVGDVSVHKCARVRVMSVLWWWWQVWE